ncbi:hydroxyacid dehydrogenase [Pelagicoccus sp. SDUM812005]|uniref:hydroxyacid dehydrogenase n=1 Tax=Pelagicoccus sp. SDUM812005 TaxID=3041257 RepID=UPI0028103CC9|nr:hydroxyacid dehydrogenase [Pelagicoccus sp. SDUM812005]MDQ8180324.1 hydroxyacid dehydrogenase [Pelagicoccus sp. SDUM812005]
MKKSYPTAMNGGRERPLKAALIGEKSERMVDAVYGEEARRRIEESFDLLPYTLTAEQLRANPEIARGIDVLFGTWGFPVLDEREVAWFENLKHIFYAAGSVRSFALPFLKAGVPISSSKLTNARVVADFCLGQILLSAKRFFQNVSQFRNFGPAVSPVDPRFCFDGYAGTKVGLIGCGRVSRRLIDLLRPRGFEILVVDPYLSLADCEAMGVAKAELGEVFATCDIVSNHLPNLPELEHCIGEAQFERMRQGATFLNTGRGAQVDEEGLVSILTRRSDIVALLDVTDPEPPTDGSALYCLPNVWLSSHIAGCVGGEVKLLVEEAIASAERWLKGEPLENLEDLLLFEQMA